MKCKKIIMVSIGLAFAGLFPVFIAVPPVVHAATDLGANASLYFITPTSSIVIGEAFSVTVMLSSDQPVNAYAFSLQYDGSALRLNDVSNANSIIAVAPSEPNMQGNVISYVGGSFTPFIGNAGKLLTLDFTAIATGTDKFFWNTSNIYLANGKGTEVTPGLIVASVDVTPVSSELNGVSTSTASTTILQGQVTANPDTTPPSIESLSFVADPFNQNQKLLSFLASDAGSGVAETDMRMRTGLFWGGWERVEDPASIPNDTWEAELKVTDNAGNVALGIIYDWPAFAQSVLIWIGFIAIVIVVLAFLMRRRRNVKIRKSA